MDTSGSSLDGFGEVKLVNTCTYIKTGKDKFDFVIGNADIGPYI